MLLLLCILIHQDGEAGADAKQTHDGLTSPSDRNSEHAYTHIVSVTNLCPKSELTAGDDSVYSELEDVTDRKRPTAPVPDDDYSLAHDPDQCQPEKFTATSESVYSLAHNPSNEVVNTPKYFILEDEGKLSSGDEQGTGGQYFILEEGAADDETGDRKVEASHGAVILHGDHEYSPLTSTGRTENCSDQGAEYTPLSQTSDGKSSALVHPSRGQNNDGQYFVSEDIAAIDEETQGGQYFILEEDAAATDADNGDAANPERDYSHLNPADRVDNSSDVDKEYTPLGLMPKKDTSLKPGTNGNNEYFELESDYSLQQQV
ncbi:hypothetical protein BaRGS_00039927 [Batillaria attramentaria]|uniref:Uncharacterized protein n=1 Tax=Batillaria attramentaria TaxID=370345 RepID=A0ABD0J1J5_9CAEN